MARQKWQEWSQDEDRLKILAAWARAGLTDEDIAEKIGISRSTLSSWKKTYPTIQKALACGKEYADRLVENSLFVLAVGSVRTVKKPMKVRTVEYDNGKRIKEEETVVMVEEEVYTPPNMAAISFWARNRMPEYWRDKVVAQQEDEGNGQNLVILTPRQARVIEEEMKKHGEEYAEENAEKA